MIYKSSLQIIGIQIFENADTCACKTLTPGWYPFVHCKEDIGSDDKRYPEPIDYGCPEDYFSIGSEDAPIVNICAVVGQNGAGKSTLLDILYGILNNFAETLTTPIHATESERLSHAYGISGRLHFSIGGVQKFINLNDGEDLYYQIINGEPEKINISGLNDEERKQVLKGFFYTIAINYSLYAFNPSDRKSLRHLRSEELYSADWLFNLFHKNDGYYIPLVITPFRSSDGSINISNENDLAAQRLSAFSLLFSSQGESILQGYTAHNLTYKYNDRYQELKIDNYRYKHCPDVLRNSIDLIIGHFSTVWESLLTEVWQGFKLSSDPNRKAAELFYLAYKSTRICLTYPAYQELFELQSLYDIAETVEKSGNTVGYGSKNIKEIKSEVLIKWLNSHTSNIKAVIKKIYETKDNHITLKIHQCLTYLRNDNYKKQTDTIPITEIIGTKVFEKYDDVMKLLPPAFIDYQINFKKDDQKTSDEPEITFAKMSSGERQMLYAMSYVLYHIHNIASVDEQGQAVIGYANVNLVFDEAELYYHPEYQRRFVSLLLDRLKHCHIKSSVINSINIIIVTHSPFIISDIPNTNILYLPLEKNRAERKTLGGNIYDLLQDTFFLSSDIGEFIKDKLNEILKVYHETDKVLRKTFFERKQKEFRYTVNNLSEPYLHNAFDMMVGDMESEYLQKERLETLDSQIKQLEEERERLAQQREYIIKMQNPKPCDQ